MIKCLLVSAALLSPLGCGFLPKKKVLSMRSEIPAVPGIVDEASGSSSTESSPEGELQPMLETCKAENSQVIPLRQSFSQLSYKEYVNTLNSLFGFDVQSLALTFQETRQPGSKFTSVAAETQAFSDLHIQRLYYSAEKIAEHLVANPGLLGAKTGCNLSDDLAKTCYRTTVDYFVPRILRRELASAEANQYYALADNKSSLEGAHALFHGLLSSPSFLFVIEFTESASGTKTLSLPELKTRVGLLFYRSASHPAMDALVSKEPEQIAAFIQAQLQVQEVKDSLLFALSEWMKLDKIPLLEKEDLAAGIVFNEAMKQAIKGELEALLTDYMWNQPSFAEVLRSPYSFINDRVSDIYGVTMTGAQLQKKDLPADRSGMLTTPGLMSLSSKAARTSIVNRGLYVLEVLGCQTIPSPPANVIVDIEVNDGNVADLEKAHSANPQCAGCHVRIDPVGSGLEGFDHVGLVRGSYPNGDIVKTEGRFEGKDFKSAKELANVLVEGGHFANCARQKIVEFALRESRAAGSFCLHSQLVPDASKLSFSGFLAAFLSSDSFLQYRLEQ